MKRRYVRVIFEDGRDEVGTHVWNADTGRRLDFEVPGSYVPAFRAAAVGDRIRATIYRYPVRLARTKHGRRKRLASERVAFRVVGIR